MNTATRIKNRAADFGWTWDTESGAAPGWNRLSVYAPGTTVVRAEATFGQGRFAGGYVTDRMGHLIDCPTVKDLLRFMGDS